MAPRTWEQEDSDSADTASEEVVSDREGSESENAEGRSQEVEEDEDERRQEGSGFAQYLDSEDDIEEESESEEDGSEGKRSAKKLGQGEKEDEEVVLEQQMRKLPYSALLKARYSMQGDEDDENGIILDDSEEDEFETDRHNAKPSFSTKVTASQRDQVLAKLQEASESAEGQQRREERRKRKEGAAAREIEKRGNKHAPTEMSSRKPVSRKRSVVEMPSEKRRDPRFSSLSASVPNAGLYQSSYGFLRDKQSKELTELKTSLGRLKRQEANHAGPRAKSEMAIRVREEKERVEAALRREEGRENERKKREREREVLKKEKKKMEDKVQQGGKRYFLKDSDKRKLFLQDKFSRLAGPPKESGDGGGDVDGDTRSSKMQLRKAMERRRKKNTAKERKDMPLGGGGAMAGGAGGAGGAGFGIPKRKKENDQGQSYFSTSEAPPKRKRGRRGGS